MARVGWIGAISEDYPGSLLDLRHRLTDDVPEAVRALSLAEAAGFRLPAGDDGRLAIRTDDHGPDDHGRDDDHGPGDHGRGDHRTGAVGDHELSVLDGEPYIVFHPAASVPARQPDLETTVAISRRLQQAGRRVIITGSPEQRGLTATVAGDRGLDLGGRTALPTLATVLAGADVVVAPNTGPAHLAAAVRTPVVSLFAPVVPAARWAPYGVPKVVLGDQHAPCRGTRARECPISGHPCLAVDPDEVVATVDQLAPGGRS